MRDHAAAHIIIIILFLGSTLNLLLLNWKVFSASTTRISDMQAVAPEQPEPLPSPCDEHCQQAVQTEVARILPTLLPTMRAPTPLSEENSSPITRHPSLFPRELYIPLGTGSATQSSWEDLVGTETFIDPAQYGTIAHAEFIAGVRNPTGNGQIEVQLFNVTDKHPVWGSHITIPGATVQTVRSGNMTLDTGNKLYRVQIKSTLGYQVFLDAAKIRIVTR